MLNFLNNNPLTKLLFPKADEQAEKSEQIQQEKVISIPFQDDVIFMANIIKNCPREIVLDTLKNIDLNDFVSATSRFSNIQKEERNGKYFDDVSVSIDYKPDNSNEQIVRFTIKFDKQASYKNEFNIAAHLMFLNFDDSKECIYDSSFEHLCQDYAKKVNEIFVDVVERFYLSVVTPIANAHNSIK